MTTGMPYYNDTIVLNRTKNHTEHVARILAHFLDVFCKITRIEYWILKQLLIDCLFSEFPRQWRSKQHQIERFLATNICALYPRTSDFVVQTHLHESGILWMQDRWVKYSVAWQSWERYGSSTYLTQSHFEFKFKEDFGTEFFLTSTK